MIDHEKWELSRARFELAEATKRRKLWPQPALHVDVENDPPVAYAVFSRTCVDFKSEDPE